jgi:23S rRNA pseudouridine1911/1915/1917 synthase
MAASESLVKIIYEDEHLVVVDKPAGMLAVPIAGSRVTNMLDLVKKQAGDASKTDIRSVHRIDRYTSGLMVFTKTHHAYDHLFEQFKKHQPDRIYVAIVRGIVNPPKGELRHHLKLIKAGFRNIVVNPEEDRATPARLTYRVKEYLAEATLVEVELDTGLKNQIRVQFEEEGHQLIGDQHYAPEEIKENLMHRQALHAWKLAFIHPETNQPADFVTEFPADLLRLIDRYRWKKELHKGK